MGAGSKDIDIKPRPVLHGPLLTSFCNVCFVGLVPVLYWSKPKKHDSCFPSAEEAYRPIYSHRRYVNLTFHSSKSCPNTLAQPIFLIVFDHSFNNLNSVFVDG
jgi:hypothetical protein